MTRPRTSKARSRASTGHRCVKKTRGIAANAHLEQASVYDATRHRLLHGREDMLGLVAAQLKHKVESKEIKAGKAVWVDVSLDVVLLTG